MISYSKEGQDLFVLSLIKEKGYFLDIGSDKPIEDNNTYLLEQNGWRGLCFDQNPNHKDNYSKLRESLYLCGDIKGLDWGKFLKLSNVPKAIDYVSLDVDNCNIDVIKNFPFKSYDAKIITFETDLYNNHARKEAILKFLSDYPEYQILHENVKVQGLEFEDWIINMNYFNKEILNNKTKGCSWEDILVNIGLEYAKML